MFQGIILWLLGIPLGIIVLLWFFGVLQHLFSAVRVTATAISLAG
jgi:hypothetical protein